MVCPLRFVLLGASAAVAVCGVVFVTHNKSKQGKYERQAQDDTVWWRTVVDMMTGRYLWQAYVDWRDHDASEKVA